MVNPPSSGFELPPADRAALGQAALDWCLQYFDTVDSRAVYPAVGVDALTAALTGPLPLGPQPVAEVMAQFTEIVAGARHNGHPRMFGYVQSSGTFVGAVADLLTSALNQNVTSWRSAPSATTIERQVIDWVRTIVGMPAGTTGLLMSGGSMANLAGVATALRAATDVDVNRLGVAAIGAAPVLYASSLVHMSIPKAAALLGLGRDAVRLLPVDGQFRLDVPALERAIADDRAAGRLPVCVVASGGEVNTGAVDPLDAIADVCARHQVWLHVDGSYGGFAVLAPSAASQFGGLARADSVSLDPHKWLYAPLDLGCLLVRDGRALRRAFSHGASYIDVIADEQMSEFAFWDYGPELSRRFRALKLWFTLKVYGTDAVAAAIEANLQVARHLAGAIDASDDFERLAPVPLSIVCFRYLPPAFRDRAARREPAALEELDVLNRALLVEVQRDGDAYLSNAVVDGAFALRACVVNYRTTPADCDRLLAAIRHAARRR